MENKSSQKAPVNKEHFIEVLKLKNSSIRKLSEAYEEIKRTEKTIRRCLDNGEMPPDLLNRIAKYLNVHPDYLSGLYNNKADRIEDDFLRIMYRSSIKPEKYPTKRHPTSPLELIGCQRAYYFTSTFPFSSTAQLHPSDYLILQNPLLSIKKGMQLTHTFIIIYLLLSPIFAAIFQLPLIILLTLNTGRTTHSTSGCAVKRDNSLRKCGIKIATLFFVTSVSIKSFSSSFSDSMLKNPDKLISSIYSSGLFPFNNSVTL